MIKLNYTMTLNIFEKKLKKNQDALKINISVINVWEE